MLCSVFILYSLFLLIELGLTYTLERLSLACTESLLLWFYDLLLSFIINLTKNLVKLLFMNVNSTDKNVEKL